MKIIINRHHFLKIAPSFLLTLLESYNKNKKYFFYEQSYIDSDKILYKKLKITDEKLKTVNPNIYDYILVTTKDFGPSFTSNFSYAVNSYILYHETYYDSSIAKEESKINHFTTPSLIFHRQITKVDKNWRTNEKLVKIIEESLKNYDMKNYYKLHTLKVVDVPDDVDWVLESDEGWEHVRENIEVRTWY